MSLSKFVKVGEVSNLSDARYCAGMGVDIMGFVIDPENEAYVNPDTFAEIVGWVAGVSYCGEFSASSLENYTEQISKYELQYIQCDNLDALNGISGVEKILQFNISAKADLEELQSILIQNGLDLAYILIEAEDSLVEATDNLLQEVQTNYQIIKGYGLSAETVDSLNSSFHGIALKGSAEIRPGYKDFDELADILEVLEED